MTAASSAFVTLSGFGSFGPAAADRRNSNGAYLFIFRTACTIDTADQWDEVRHAW